MNLKAKLIGDEDERAVSPVIGVILMVAITVILAAVIAAFVLDLGSSVQADVQAGANIDTNAANDETVVTFTSAQESDTTLTVKYHNGSSDVSETLNDIGDSYTIDDASLADSDFRITIVAENGDRSTVVQTKDISH